MRDRIWHNISKNERNRLCRTFFIRKKPHYLSAKAYKQRDEGSLYCAAADLGSLHGAPPLRYVAPCRWVSHSVSPSFGRISCPEAPQRGVYLLLYLYLFFFYFFFIFDTFVFYTLQLLLFFSFLYLLFIIYVLLFLTIHRLFTFSYYLSRRFYASILAFLNFLLFFIHYFF